MICVDEKLLIVRMPNNISLQSCDRVLQAKQGQTQVLDTPVYFADGPLSRIDYDLLHSEPCHPVHGNSAVEYALFRCGFCFLITLSKLAAVVVRGETC